MIFDRLLRKEANVSLSFHQIMERLAARQTTAAGVNVTAERAMRHAAVFASVRVLAESVGQLPLPLYKRNGRAKEKAVDHPLYSLLHDAPSEDWTSQEWLEFSVGSLALRGDAFCQIARGVGRRPVALRPFHPDGVTPKRNRSRELLYDIALENGKTETLPADEVLHIKLMPAADGLHGLSPLRALRESIGIAIGAEEYGASLFKNGANPGGVVQFPEAYDLSPEVYERLKSSWEERHQGSDNAHKVAILEKGATWQSIGMTADDAQFLDTRKYQRSEIAGVFRVPPHLIGDLERATYSNIEQQSLDFIIHCLMPYLRRIEQRIALQLLSEEERRVYFAKFTVASLLRGDMAARSAFYTAMINASVMSPNEARDLEDWNPRDGGDEFITPLNVAVGGKPADGGASGADE